MGRWIIDFCAHFSTADVGLNAAQEAKMEHICRKLRLRPDDRLLDIGWGWGGLLLNHTITTHHRRTDTWLEKSFLQPGQFIQKYVFPGGELLWIGEMQKAAERMSG